jgi:hypothetical protein
MKKVSSEKEFSSRGFHVMTSTMKSARRLGLSKNEKSVKTLHKEKAERVQLNKHLKRYFLFLEKGN